MKPITLEDLKEMQSRAHMCEEATIPGDRLRALIHTARFAYEMKKALSEVLDSEALKEAPFYNYSEAVACAKEALALWDECICGDTNARNCPVHQ